MYKAIIVDDEKNIRERIAQFFPWDEYNFEVVAIAKDGLDAIKLVDKHKPDLVISDIKMPNMDGIQLAEKLHQYFPEIITVFISSYSEFDLAQQAIKFNVKGYLLKPIMKNDFRELMNSLFNQNIFPERVSETPDTSFNQSKSESSDEKVNQYISEAKNYMHQHYHEAITLKDIANELYIHESYFSKLFNQEMGVGFNVYLNEIRIEKAKEQLKYTSKHLKDISNEVGFSSHSYFNRVFKQIVGISPLNFRKTSEK